jgi:hypothetical protein
MNESKINLPTPMTPEARRAIQRVFIASRLFAYGLNDWETAACYKEKCPRFTDEQCWIFLMCSSGVTAKQHRNALKKESKNGKAYRKYSR